MADRRAVALVVGLLLGCATQRAPRGPEASRPEPRAEAVSPTQCAGEPVPTDLSADPEWQRSLEGRDMDLGELAQREGAGRLAAALRYREPYASTAARALTHAEDGLSVMPEVCDALAQCDGDTRHNVLLTVHELAQLPVISQESYDPAGDHHCLEILQKLLKQSQLPAADHDLGASAVRLLQGRLTP